MNFAALELQTQRHCPESVTRMPPVGPEDAALESTRLGLRFHTDLLCLQLDINPHTT